MMMKLLLQIESGVEKRRNYINNKQIGNTRREKLSICKSSVILNFHTKDIQR